MQLLNLMHKLNKNQILQQIGNALIIIFYIKSFNENLQKLIEFIYKIVKKRLINWWQHYIIILKSFFLLFLLECR